MAGDHNAWNRAYEEGDKKVDGSELPTPGLGDEVDGEGMSDICDVAVVASTSQPRLGANEWPVVSECNSPCLRRLKKTYSR
jgi:hypothetical protein